MLSVKEKLHFSVVLFSILKPGTILKKQKFNYFWEKVVMIGVYTVVSVE